MQLEDAEFLEGARGELLALRTLGTEIQVYAGDDGGRAQLLGLGDALHTALDRLDRGVEGAQSVELHGLSLRGELLHARDDVLEHQHEHVVGGQLAVLAEVAGEALERQRLAALGLGEVLAVAS